MKGLVDLDVELLPGDADDIAILNDCTGSATHSFLPDQFDVVGSLIFLRSVTQDNELIEKISPVISWSRRYAASLEQMLITSN